MVLQDFSAILYVLQYLYQWNAILIMASASMLIILSPFFTLFVKSKSNHSYSTVLSNLSMEGDKKSV
jgi:hypothetical protein